MSKYADAHPLLFTVICLSVIIVLATIVSYIIDSVYNYNRWKNTNKICDAKIWFNCFLASYCKSKDKWCLKDDYVLWDNGVAYRTGVSFETYTEYLKYKRFRKLLKEEEERKEKLLKKQRESVETAKLLSDIAKEYNLQTVPTGYRKRI